MKAKLFRFLPCALALFVSALPVFSQSKSIDAASEKLVKEIMENEMVTVIHAKGRMGMENFAGTEGTQVINAYKIAKHEVTQELYTAVMGENPSYFKDNPASGEVQKKRPVENVSWYDAVYFCNKLSILMGLTPAYSINGQTDPEKWDYTPHKGESMDFDYSKVICNFLANGFRLPTEAEWEMAARGGMNGGWDYKYPGSDRLNDVAWCDDNSYEMIDGRYKYKTHEVGKKQANVLGLYDMSGNVWEWCCNYYDRTESFGLSYRGGSYSSYDTFCDVSYRKDTYPANRNRAMGFRVACSAF